MKFLAYFMTTGLIQQERRKQSFLRPRACEVTQPAKFQVRTYNLFDQAYIICFFVDLQCSYDLIYCTGRMGIHSIPA